MKHKKLLSISAIMVLTASAALFFQNCADQNLDGFNTAAGSTPAASGSDQGGNPDPSMPDTLTDPSYKLYQGAWWQGMNSARMVPGGPTWHYGENESGVFEIGLGILKFWALDTNFNYFLVTYPRISSLSNPPDLKWSFKINVMDYLKKNMFVNGQTEAFIGLLNISDVDFGTKGFQVGTKVGLSSHQGDFTKCSVLGRGLNATAPVLDKRCNVLYRFTPTSTAYLYLNLHMKPIGALVDPYGRSYPQSYEALAVEIRDYTSDQAHINPNLLKYTTVIDL